MARLRLTRRKSLLINLALMLGSFLCCLAGLEAAARVWEQAQSDGPYAWELIASRRIQLDRFVTPDGGYTKMQPDKTYVWQSIPVQINSQGLRGEELELAKTSDTYRILNVGDSVVFGWGVRYDDTYGYRLQGLLNDRFSSDSTTYQVINAGVPGWNMENILSYLKAEGMAYQPDLILLNFTVVNDVYGRSSMEEADETVFARLRDHTYFWPFLSTQYHLLHVRLGSRNAVPVLDVPSEASSYFPIEEQDPKWDAVWEQIWNVAKLAREHGAQFLLVVLPTAFQVQDTSYSSVPQQVIARRSRSEGIQVVDLLPLFQKACREAPPGESCGPEGRYLWADMWMHPSALGHRLIAEEVLSALQGKAWH